MTSSRRLGAVLVVLAVLAGACGGGGSDEESSDKKSDATGAESTRVAKTPRISLAISKSLVLHPEGALNATTAIDPETGAVYAAWARELRVPEGSEEDPLLEAVVARSADHGETFEEPVVVNPPGMRIVSYTVSPTQVEIGPHGEVFVLFLKNVPQDLPGYAYGLSSMQLVRSDDGGKTFSEPVDVAPEASEGVVTSMEMATLFVAPDGDLFVSFLDFRERIAVALDRKAGKTPAPEHTGHGAMEPPPTQLRTVRSTDGGKTFSKSVLVSKPACACCGTKVAQGKNTPLFATTRSDWKELKGSKDSVRDPFLSVSRDEGETWAAAVKIHDDKFKISGCPDVNAGLSTDSKDQLHAAWYTGTEKGPGIYYAVSKNDGKTFSKPIALMTDEWVPYSDVQMVIDEDDRVWVAYEDRRGDVDKVQVVRVQPDGTLSYSKAWPGHAPDLAAHGGEAVVVWGTKAAAEDKSGPVKVASVSRAGAGEDARSSY